MKVCKKCKNEYKDEYMFCNKCGEPYNETVKRAKIKGEKFAGASPLIRVWNILLYIFGGIMILGSLLNITAEPITSIFGILFGLSLFEIFYRLVEDNIIIDSKIIKIMRIILPIVLIIIFGIVTPSDSNSDNKTVKNTTCYFEYNEKEADGMISRMNLHLIHDEKGKSYVESLTKYVFENDELAYNYYKNAIEQLKQNGNDVHLINNIITIYNNKSISDEQVSANIALFNTDNSCKENDESIMKKFENEKNIFINERTKSEEYINSKKEQNKIETKQETNKENNTTKSKKGNNYMDALRKCTVMEGADIYTTGIGKKSDNVFNDARESCELWYSQFGEEEFIKIQEEDWNNRQNEQVEGKPLSHYLEVLGW